jgi:ribosomal protein S12 methylthiotransferase accessory factor
MELTSKKLELHSNLKYLDGAIPRTVAPSQTYQRLKRLMPRVGITHVMEITKLDDLDLPIFLAFGPLEANVDLRHFANRLLPDSEALVDKLVSSVEVFSSQAEPPDGKQVFSAGKGLTPIDSRVSAMMEAIEHTSALQPSVEPRLESYERLKRSNSAVLDPRSLILIAPDQFSDDQKLEWVPGFDLRSGDPIWVPADAATFCYRTVQAARVCSDTPTGLGAGNTLEEAISHALAEVIEHDAWSLGMARMALASAQNGLTASIFGYTKDASAVGTVPETPFRSLDLASIADTPPVGELVQQLERAGAQLRVYDITSDISIPVFSASINGIPGQEDGGGLGAHPDARLALTRAITEAAQQRLVLGLQSLAALASPVKRWKKSAWEEPDSSPVYSVARRFDELPSSRNLDILEDIDCMLAALQSRGYEQIVLVDLTKPEFEIPVVKVIVPGLADYWTSDAPPQWSTLTARIQRSKDGHPLQTKESQHV